MRATGSWCKPKRTPEAVSVYLACLKRGAVYVPVNTVYTKPEVEYFIADCEPRLFVASRGFDTDVQVAVLDGEGSGTFWRESTSTPMATVDRAGRRPRRDHLHLRHDRSLEGRDAHPRQPALQRGDTVSCMGLARRRRVAARVADLPRARLVRSLALCIPECDAGGSAEAFRRCGIAARTSPRHRLDGCADVLHPTPGRGVVRCRVVCQHAPVHLGFGTADGADLRGVRTAHGLSNSRALRQ